MITDVVGFRIVSFIHCLHHCYAQPSSHRCCTACDRRVNDVTEGTEERGGFETQMVLITINLVAVILHLDTSNAVSGVEELPASLWSSPPAANGGIGPVTALVIAV